MLRGELDVEQRVIAGERMMGNYQPTGEKSGLGQGELTGKGVRGEECRLEPRECQHGKGRPKKELAKETRSGENTKQLPPEGEQEGK